MKPITTTRPDQFICEYIEDLHKKILVPLFEVYTYIIRTADYTTNELSVNNPELAHHLGYTRLELEVILRNLVTLGVISVSVENEFMHTIKLRDQQAE